MLKDHSTELRDEQLSKRPATPLPWKHQQPSNGQFITDESGNGIANAYRGKENAAKENAAYITHAANSYPRLVEALKHTIWMAATRDRQAVEDALNSARDLLRELGEAE